MGNSRFTFALDAFRSGPLQTLVSCELQWEPRCMASAEWCSFGKSVAQESDMLSRTSQLFSQGTLHTVFQDLTSLFGNRQVPYIACTHGPAVRSPDLEYV